MSPINTCIDDVEISCCTLIPPRLLFASAKGSSSSLATVNSILRITPEPRVLPTPLIKDRTPVIVPPGMLGRYLFPSWGSSCSGSLIWLSFRVDRQERNVNQRAIAFLLLSYHNCRLVVFRCRFAFLFATKRVRNAVIAVRIRPTSPAVSSQKVSQIESSLPSDCMPEARTIVKTTITTVKHKEQKRAIFWLHRIRIFQMSRIGMNKTI